MLALDSFFEEPRPSVMGVLNATPDSFSDGGKFNRINVALQRIEEMIQQGATIIDIGGESTRPYASVVEESEEVSRVIPILESAVARFSNQVLFPLTPRNMG